jgi:NAD/NADP transhydrogenase beta subunit
MSTNLATVAYIAATILFILSLGGLSNPETSRRGNSYGILGMAIAVLATVFGPRVTAAGIPWIVGALVVGGSVGLYAARKVRMTQMPELVALQCTAWSASPRAWSASRATSTPRSSSRAPRRPSTRSRSTSAS